MGHPEKYIMERDLEMRNNLQHNQVGKAQEVTAELRTKIFNETGEYMSDEEISKRGDGMRTSYYDIPNNATQLRHLISYKRMSHSIGEAFCALYRLKDNGEYKRNLLKAKFYIECELEELVNDRIC